MIKTIQQPPVPKAGGDLELSVSYVGEEMAECHARVLMNLVEYQWNRKNYSTHTQRRGEGEREGIFLLHRSTQLHIFYAAVLKPCKKNPKFQVHHTYIVFSLPSQWNDLLWVHPMSVMRGCIPCSPIKGWPAPPPIPLFLLSLLKLQQLCYAVICNLHEDKKKSLLGNIVWMCPTQTDSKNQQNCSHKSHSQSLLLWSAEQLQIVDILCRPLQHSESMSQKYIKIVPMSRHKSKLYGFISTDFLI